MSLRLWKIFIANVLLSGNIVACRALHHMSYQEGKLLGVTAGCKMLGESCVYKQALGPAYHFAISCNKSLLFVC